MRQRSRFLWLLGILLFPWVDNSSAFAEDSGLQTHWQKAIQAYQAKDFAIAREQFEKIMATGKIHADLYYNLGNTLFQLGEKGRAAWMYEKALAANPRHSQAKANLLLIRNDGQTQQNPGSLKFLGAPFAWLGKQFSANEWFVTAALLYTITCILLSLWLVLHSVRWRDALRSAWIFSLIITLAASLIAGTKIALLEQHAYGVVIKKGTIVRSAPGVDEPEYFSVKEGERLEVQDAGVHGWTTVKNPVDGKVGYLPEDAILRL